MRRIVVSEYPKSGGTWCVNMIADSIGWPKRDIYVHQGIKKPDFFLHPWYKGAESLDLTECCVIKSHEVPGSGLLMFDFKSVHMIRDGRDVVVSRYFFEKEYMIKNDITKEFKTPFDEYIRKTAAEWRAFIIAWEGEPVIVCRYEELLRDTFSTLRVLLSALGEDPTDKTVRKSIRGNTKRKIKKSLRHFSKHNSFVRKGIAGDWKNHFTEQHKDIFKEAAGDMLIRLRYEADNNW